MVDAWTVRLRRPDLRLADPLDYDVLTLSEGYNTPDMLALEGDLADLALAVPGTGCVAYDDTGAQRFSGMLTEVDRRGSNGGEKMCVYAGDSVLLRWRRVWPDPAVAWPQTSQNVAVDRVTGTVETRILSLVNRHLGPGAYNVAPYLRRVSAVAIPASQNRGPSGASGARFDVLGDVVATIAELADLRVTIEQRYTGTTPRLQVVVSDAPDLSAWARFGTATEGGPGVLADDWHYKVTMPTATMMLSAATNEGTSRVLTSHPATGTVDPVWGTYIEGFVDQRLTEDPAELVEGLKTAYAEAVGAVEVSATVDSGSDFVLGTDVPVGAKVTLVLDGQVFVERVRKLTTTVGGQDGSVSVSAVVGAAGQDGSESLTATQKQMNAALRRLSVLERR